MNTENDTLIRTVIVLGAAGAYLLMLGFLAVMWLCFGHNDLKDWVGAGFTFLGGAAAGAVAHYAGANTTATTFRAGLAAGCAQTGPTSPGALPDPPPPPR